jgi:hypothetical protein
MLTASNDAMRADASTKVYVEPFDFAQDKLHRKAQHRLLRLLQIQGRLPHKASHSINQTQKGERIKKSQIFLQPNLDLFV